MTKLVTAMLTVGMVLWGAAVNAASAQVEIANAWVKESIPGAMNGAGYLELTNTGDSEIVLIGVKTPAAGRSEVHEHVMANGMMKMQHVHHLAIPAGETVVFQPGGYHLMMFGVKQPLRVGDTVPFVLEFGDGASVEFGAKVVKIQ